jgi:hypothetical protein
MILALNDYWPGRSRTQFQFVDAVVANPTMVVTLHYVQLEGKNLLLSLLELA